MPEGGCQCGAVRYAVNRLGKPYVCHCRDCQRQSSSAFAISVPAWADELVIEGNVASYSRPAASGARTDCFFCPRCGTRLYHRSTSSTDRVTLKGGTLDNAVELMPDAHLWIGRKAGWVAIPEGAEHFETQPDDLKAWRAARLPPR